MMITQQAFLGLLTKVVERAQVSEQALNAADAKLGDGDTGSMLCRVIGVMAASGAIEAESLSKAAMNAAQAAMRETGSSLGTLIATAMLTLAKEAEARGDAVSEADMAKIIAAIGDAISARGKAAAGDKTVVDSIRAIASAFQTGPVTIETARQGAVDALQQLRGQPCKIGRARMFPERSVGADDPGMLAVALLLGADQARISAFEKGEPAMEDTRTEAPWRDLTDPRKVPDDGDLEAGLKEPLFENLEIPEHFGPVTITVDDHKIKRFAFTQDDYNPWSLDSSPFDEKRIGQACLLGNDLVQLFTLRYAGSKTVGLHTEEQMWFESPAVLGEKVTLSGEYIESFERRGQDYVVMEARAIGEDGRTIIRHRGVEILRTVPGAVAGRGSGTPERRVMGQTVEGARQVDSIGADSAVGDELTPLEKVITAEQAAVFSRIGEFVRNIHSDFLVARAGQLRVPIVQGQQQVGVMGEFLTRAFGVPWFTGGWLRVKFINTLEVFEPFRVYGRVISIDRYENGQSQAELEIWIRRASDQKITAVGWARGPVPT